MIKGLSAAGLETMIKEEKEAGFLVVDVRQPEEYRLNHIPGSINIPLAEIQFDPYLFDDDRKLIFCCSRGRRSKVAAIFVSEAGYDEDLLFHLENGLFEYSGELLLEMPRIEYFPEDIGVMEALETAVNFEKGAYRFYMLAKKKAAGSKLYGIFDKMAGEEIVHGKAVFNRMKKLSGLTIDFNDYFASCDGQVLEGGKAFCDVEAFFDSILPNPCIDILDFAIDLEYGAYDLYKTMAENTRAEDYGNGKMDDRQPRDMFFSMAQAEKSHLDQVIKALALCS